MKKISVYIAFIALTLSACVKKDHFGSSMYGEIKSIQVSSQAAAAIIDPIKKEVEIALNEEAQIQEIEILAMELSSFASADQEVGSIIDLSSPFVLSITSESKSVTEWTIYATSATPEPQLANSDFEDWYSTPAGYLEPGISEESTFWGTGNPGGALLDKIATTPIHLSNGSTGAALETLDNGFLGQIANTPITAATIYTGYFESNNIDINDPRAAVVLGTPFSGRPSKFSIDYSYVPGIENKDRSGQALPYGDQCDIYMFLEVRENGQNKRLATALFRSGETVEDMVNIDVELIYGALDASFPEDLLPEDGFVAENEIENTLPTHISFLATSSFGGARFEGAVGSKLIIDNLQLIY